MSLPMRTPSLLQTVAEDLLFLKSTCHAEVENVALRQTASTLRRLVVYQEYIGAWKEAGFDGEPTVTYETLDWLTRTTFLQNIGFAFAGGAVSNGLEIRGATMIRDGGLPHEQERRTAVRKVLGDRTTGLNAFRDSSSIISQAEEISRGRVITYVANKLGGGGHFDEGRELKAKNRKPTSTEEAMMLEYMILDGLYGTANIAFRDGVLFELLSIAQNLADSGDAGRLISVARERRLLDNPYGPTPGRVPPGFPSPGSPPSGRMR